MGLSGSEIVESLRRNLGPVGFDIVQPFAVAPCNEAAPALRLPDFARPDPLGVLVGNTRAFWPVFLHAYRADAELRAARHPIELHTERALTRAADTLRMRHEVRFAHAPGATAPPMQLIAAIAGLAHQAPCGLSIHPEYGPWLALRAVVVLDTDGPEQARAPVDTCSACAKPCMRVLARALDACGHGIGKAPPTSDDITRTWRAWVAVRDACPLGCEHRYGDSQIEYHYTRNRKALDDDA